MIFIEADSFKLNQQRIGSKQWGSHGYVIASDKLRRAYTHFFAANHPYSPRSERGTRKSSHPHFLLSDKGTLSQGNKNREIHQTVPDHRIPLTVEGRQQALEAGWKLRALLRPDDTIHCFTSPYLRTRQTTEGILQSLCSDDPSPSPFPRHTIKVYEEVYCSNSRRLHRLTITR